MAALQVSCVIAAAVLPFACASSAFLHPPAQNLSPEQKSAVLGAIEEVLGERHRQALEVRVAPLEALLAPTLNALPKNWHGKFGHKAARYALHRLFVQRHAWFVKGIEQDGDWGNATPTEMLQGGVPEIVQHIFETRLGGNGLDAHEVAVMAATLENLAHKESMDRLHLAYKALGLVPSANTKEDDVNDLLDVYMAQYVSGMDLSDANTGGANGVVSTAESIYPGFDDVRKFVREVKKDSAPERTNFSSVDISNIITRIGDKYGRWQAHECDDLKQKLLSIENDGTGRVALSKFYNAAVNLGQWQFVESQQYLRALGALDEADPANPRVIVSNYILSPSNCVASSSYYSVCCLDECEDLIDHLERTIQAPSAEAAQIATLVAAMPSSSEASNRSIPESLLKRLDEIAESNNGLVPLHGRLFAQWMHHVYPRECPYPHLSGTTMPLRSEDYERQTGIMSVASQEEMDQCIAEAPQDMGHDVPTMIWNHAEEHYVERHEAGFAAALRTLLRVAVVAVAASLTAYPLLGRNARKEIDTWGKAHFV